MSTDYRKKKERSVTGVMWMEREGCSPESLAVGEGPQWRLEAVCSVEGDGVAPPGLDGGETDGAVLRILQAEEDDDDGDGDTRVERGREDVYRRATRSVRKEEKKDRVGAHSCTLSTRRSGGDG